MNLPTAAWQSPGHVESRGGRLTLQGVDLVDLARHRATPLYVYSAARIVETARVLRRTIQDLHPRADIFYASKALSAIKVLRLIHAAGCGIEVNSGGELFRARVAGFAPDQIVFNGVAKSQDEIQAALSPPIKAINVDSLFELSRIASVARDLGRRARIALRIVPEVDSPTSPGNRTGAEGTKFGIRQSELPAAIEMISQAGDSLLAVGLHAHIGSQIIDVAPYRMAAERLCELFTQLQTHWGHTLQHVNIGGGFPLSYLRGKGGSPQGGIFSPSIDVGDIAEAVLPLLLQKLGPEIEIIVEPGRRLVGDAAVLLTRVENMKERSDGRWLFLDAGYNTLVESYTYKWYYHALSADKLDEPTASFRVVGPLCDNGDAFFDVDGEQTLERLLQAAPELGDRRALLESLLVRLPRRRELAASTAPGDLVGFLDTGAYTLDQLTPNNGRPRPEVGMIAPDGSYELIRRRDSLADLFHNEVI